MDQIFRETTPLSEKDCFMIFSRKKKEFTFPLHIHLECELNFIENGKGAKRIVGDSVEEIDDLELTFITSPSLEHGWFTHNCKSELIKEITIQFHNGLFSEHLLRKEQFKTVRELFDKARSGVAFSKETVSEIKGEIYDLEAEPAGAYSVFKLMCILHKLSLSPMKELSSRSYHLHAQNYDSKRIEKTYGFVQDNYNKNIKLADVANIVGMTEVSFSRFLKQKTGRTFIDFLNEVKLGYAMRMLVHTNKSIEDICISCGFNNLSNFYRLFKKRKGCTPNEFRDNYKESRLYI